MTNPEVKAFFDEATFTVSYVVADPATGKAAIIDPVLDFDPASGRTSTASADTLIGWVRQKGLHIEWILETHVHADHLSAAPHVQQKLGGRTAIGERVQLVQETFGKVLNLSDLATDGSQFDHLFRDREEFRIGELTARVIATPGHTPACITYLIGDAGFVGDTLFMPDFGTARTDFPGGSATELYRSIRKLLELPEETRLFMCHDYKAPGREEYAWETTVAHQRMYNVHVHDAIDEATFVARRTARDKKLAMPRLILPSIQVNVRAGQWPEPEDNGVRYLKIPLNAI